VTDITSQEPEVSVTIIDNRIDPLIAVHSFGQLSLIMATAMPLAWRFAMRDTFNTGFKVAAYINMIFSAPYSFVYLLFLAVGDSRDVAFYLDNAMRWSVAGIFFLNFFAIYVMIYLAITDSSSGVADYVGLAAYLAYSFFAMMYSY